jgi:hypothetical protein
MVATATTSAVTVVTSVTTGTTVKALITPGEKRNAGKSAGTKRPQRNAVPNAPSENVAGICRKTQIGRSESERRRNVTSRKKKTLKRVQKDRMCRAAFRLNIKNRNRKKAQDG